MSTLRKSLITVFDISGYLTNAFFFYTMCKIFFWTTEQGLKTGNYIAWVNSNLTGEHWYEIILLAFEGIWLLSLAARAMIPNLRNLLP